MSELENANNKDVVSYPCVLTESINKRGRVSVTPHLNKKCKDRKKLEKRKIH